MLMLPGRADHHGYQALLSRTLGICNWIWTRVLGRPVWLSLLIRFPADPADRRISLLHTRRVSSAPGPRIAAPNSAAARHACATHSPFLGPRNAKQLPRANQGHRRAVCASPLAGAEIIWGSVLRPDALPRRLVF